MAINPIQGVSTLNVGSISTFSDSTPGGTWSSTNTSVTTIDSSTGIATAIAPGVCQIVYTVGGNSTALNLSVTQQFALTNGLNFNYVYPALQNRVLYQSTGQLSDSNRYYEDFHSINNITIITELANLQNETVTEFIANKQRAIIMQMMQGVYGKPQMIDHPKLAFYRGNEPSLPFQYAQNQGQFVGLRLFIGKGDHAVKLNSLILFFTKHTTLNIYLYNDFFINPLMTIPITANAGEETIIDLGETVILNNLVPQQYKSGMWYFGYYQQDMVNPILGNDPTNEAIYYPVNYGRYHVCQIMAFSAPETTDINGNTNFLRNNIGANNLMYGMNLEVSSFRDASNTIVQNKSLFDELIGLIATSKNLELCINSYRTNALQRIIQSSWSVEKLNQELNGDPGDWSQGRPKVLGIKQRITTEYQKVQQSFEKVVYTNIGHN